MLICIYLFPRFAFGERFAQRLSWQYESPAHLVVVQQLESVVDIGHRDRLGESPDEIIAERQHPAIDKGWYVRENKITAECVTVENVSADSRPSYEIDCPFRSNGFIRADMYVSPRHNRGKD